MAIGAILDIYLAHLPIWKRVLEIISADHNNHFHIHKPYRMKYSTSFIATALLAATTVHAWLPQDRDLAAFNQTARHEALGKRFMPKLPNGVTKIRGVNFGGMFFLFFFFLDVSIHSLTQCRLARLREMDDGQRVA